MSKESASSNGLIGVLICDDDEDVRILLRIVMGRNRDMERRGLEVVGEARDGDEAVSEAKRLQPDVILLDLSMPHRTGLEALPEIKEVAPAARVIVFSGFDPAMMASDVLSRGADRYLEKGHIRARSRQRSRKSQHLANRPRPLPRDPTRDCARSSEP